MITRNWGMDKTGLPRTDSGNTTDPGPVKRVDVAKKVAQLILQTCLTILCLPRTPPTLQLLISSIMAINARAAKKKQACFGSRSSVSLELLMASSPMMKPAIEIHSATTGAAMSKRPSRCSERRMVDQADTTR